MYICGQTSDSLTRCKAKGQTWQPQSKASQMLQAPQPEAKLQLREQVTLFHFLSNNFVHMTYLIFELGDATDAGKTGFRGANTTTWRDQQMDPSIADQSAEDSEEAAMVKELRKKRLTAQRKRKGPGKPPKPGNKMSPRGGPSPKYDRAFEEEFEKVYKKDIDKFIDGSDFEVESLAGFSEISKGTFVSAA